MISYTGDDERTGLASATQFMAQIFFYLHENWKRGELIVVTPANHQAVTNPTNTIYGTKLKKR